MPLVRRRDKEGVDLLVDPNIAAAEAATAQSCASGNCKAVPATNNLQIRVCISYVFLMYFICISYVFFICIFHMYFSYVFFIPYFSYRIFHTLFFIQYFSYFTSHTVSSRFKKARFKKESRFKKDCCYNRFF